MLRKSRRAGSSGGGGGSVYDSFRKFDPSRFAENTPEWNMAMIKYLIDMKNHGHKIKEIETTKVSSNGDVTMDEKLTRFVSS